MVLAPIPIKAKDHTKHRKKSMNIIGSGSMKKSHHSKSSEDQTIHEEDESKINETKSQILVETPNDQSQVIAAAVVPSIIHSSKKYTSKMRKQSTTDSLPIDHPALASSACVSTIEPLHPLTKNSGIDTNHDLESKLETLYSSQLKAVEKTREDSRRPLLPKKELSRRLLPLLDSRNGSKQSRCSIHREMSDRLDDDMQGQDDDKDHRSIGTQTEHFLGQVLRLPKVETNFSTSPHLSSLTYLEPIKISNVPIILHSPPTTASDSNPYKYDSTTSDFGQSKPKVRINKDLSRVVADHMTQKLKQLKRSSYQEQLV